MEKNLKYRFDIPGHDKPTVGRKSIDSENSNCGLIYGGKRNRCVIFPAKQHLSHSTHTLLSMHKFIGNVDDVIVVIFTQMWSFDGDKSHLCFAGFSRQNLQVILS